VISRRRKRQHNLAPAVGEFREAVQQQHGRPARPLTLAIERDRMPGGSVPLP
jgi:hypothetical protein